MEAASFASFILSTQGKKILENQGLNPIKPVIEGSTAKVPSTIMNRILDESGD